MHSLKFVLTGLLIAAPSVALAQGEGEVEGEASVEGSAEVTADPNATVAADPNASMSTDPAAGPAKKMTVGADVAVILPLGDYSDTADLGIGVLGRFEFAVNDMISATGRVGYIHHIGTPDGISIGMIPILVGGTYKIGTSGLFVDAEVGFTMIRVSLDFMGQSTTDSETKLSFGAGLGYQMNKIKARAGFFMPGSVGEGDNSTTLYGILASVGYDFASF